METHLPATDRQAPLSKINLPATDRQAPLSFVGTCWGECNSPLP